MRAVFLSLLASAWFFASSTASLAAMSPEEIRNCDRQLEQFRKQVMAGSGTTEDKRRAFGMMQKSLFSLHCSGHPQAKARMAEAEAMIRGNAPPKPANQPDGKGGQGPEKVRLQSNVKCAAHKISTRPVSHTDMNRHVIGIKNTCQRPMYIHWVVRRDKQATHMVDFIDGREMTPARKKYFKPQEQITSKPFDVPKSRAVSVQIIAVCPIESEFSKMVGKRVVHSRAISPAKPDVCEADVWRSSDVPTAK